MIRLARPADLDHVLDLVEALELEDPGARPFNREATQQALGRVAGDPTLGRLWLLVADEVPVGYALLTFGFSLEYLGRDAFLDSFYILPTHRGQGHGKALLAQLEADAHTHDVQALHLEVTPDLPAAHLYRGAGYVEHHRLLMTKWLRDSRSY